MAASLLLGAAVFLGSAAAGTVPEPGLTAGPLGGPERPPEEARTEPPWTRRLSETYGTPPELIASLRALGLDRIEVECAVAVSTRAHRPIGEVLLLRRAGIPWSEIAHGYGFGLIEAIRPPPAARTKNAPPVLERSSP